MASNYTQSSQTSDNPPLNATLEEMDIDDSIQPEVERIDRHDANDGLHQAMDSDFKILNDPQLIRSRRVNYGPKARKRLELMCEDKVSKYKLEEVHSSLPSSVKSTFIMTFSPDARKVASTHGDHRIYICDLNTGKLLDTLEGHPKTPWCLAWHPSKREILASGCLAGEVRVWDLNLKACESWTTDNNTIITSLDFHPKDNVLVIATANDIHFWDWNQSIPFAKTTTTHDKEKVKFVEFDSSGTKLVTGISNLPKFAGYSSDSLQNRIIDSYLTQGTLDQLSTENMTQTSEITSPLNNTLNTNDTLNERNANQLILNRQLPGPPNNEQDINYRSTLTLSRVASLYRHLEALEDSMRHTSFSPYINPQSISSTVELDSRNLIQPPERGQSSEEVSDVNEHTPTTNEEVPPMQQQQPSPSQDTLNQPSQSGTTRSARAPNAFEPLVVSFDESLEQLQLQPLVVDGQPINQATVIEQYPLDLPFQVHYVMQYESINQVNQNFIRISKLMSSVRLYRQIVQQILSNSSGQGHYQPNQILTAKSVLPRSSRHAPSLPIVFRNFPIGGPIEPNNLRGIRSTDPILAIQFRNSARNVPLVTICKIDLLSARSVCIMRSQQLIEQAISGLAQVNENSPGEANDRPNSAGNNVYWNSRASDNIDASPSIHPILNQLHQSLSDINHAALTTSNVHTHISSLRSIVNNLLTTISQMFPSQDEGRRLVQLIHDIAHSLTGRSWNIPLGATLDDIRLDVVYILCIVDLSLHLTRQMQLLQMQRLSLIARIEESRRTASSLNQLAANATPGTSTSSTSNNESSNQIIPSTSREDSTSNSSSTKRKENKLSDEDTKRRRVEARTSEANKSSSDTVMIDANRQPEPTTIETGVNFNTANNHHQNTSANQSTLTQTNGVLSETLPADRLVVWNSSQTHAVEQSLQRFLFATASSMNNSHILVRIYHRLHGSLTSPASNVQDQSNDRSNPPFESRRRALSQDNSLASEAQESVNPNNVDQGARSRQIQVNYSSPIMNNLEAWQRHPHLHVYQTRGAGQHLWFNQWTFPLPVSHSNYRIQCWNFSKDTIPNIKDSQSNIVTQKCRIHNDASIDISSDGGLIACLVPRENGNCVSNYDLKIFSLKSHDFGICYYQLPHGPNAISVSMSPSAGYAVVGLASNKFISNDPSEDDLTIAKVFKLDGKHSSGYVRDIKIKRTDSSLSLNAIRWMSRGIVYNVGPQHHQRYQATRMRNRVV